ncbi:MAG: DUF6473 family protein [Paracoccaceae bacterium]
MAYVFPGEGSLDYFPCRYGASRLMFRGPRRSIERPYVAYLGGTETYGKYVPDPFPDLVEDQIGIGSANLACVNAGLDVYLSDPDLMKVVRGAAVVVVQIVGAANLSNRYYSVHPRRNDRFIGATPLLKSLYPEVDFTEFNFTRHMLLTLLSVSQDRFEVVADELRRVWVGRMTQLMAALPPRRVLLWMADHQPPMCARRTRLTDPFLVDEAMIAQVRPLATTYVEAISTPQMMLAGLEEMAFPPLESVAAAGSPSPAVHRHVAQILAQVLEPALQ